MGRDVLYHAATKGEHDAIADRLSRDRWYGQWLSPLVRATCPSFVFNVPSGIPQVDARISIFRGEVRSVAGAAIASYGINDAAQADEYLLPSLTYIYPVDPVVSIPFHSFRLLLTVSVD